MAAKRNSRNQPVQKSFPWGVLIIGMLTGAFVMFLIHLNDNVPADGGNKAKKKIEKKSTAIEPTFDFYTLLPEMEMLVNKPNNKKPIVTSPPKKQDMPSKQADKTSYMVQVGSFRKSSDADAFKAKLAFLGIESKVQTVTIDNKDTWHRVHIGPIVGRDKADALQKQLKQNDIDSLLMRAKHS